MIKLVSILALGLIIACTTVPPSRVLPLERPEYGGEPLSEEQAKKNAEFIATIERSITLGSGYYDLGEASMVWAGKGWMSLALQDYSSAVARFNEAWVLDPKNPDVYWGYGHWYAAQDHFEASVAMFDRCLALKPYHLDAMADLAYTYNRWFEVLAHRGDSKEALKRLKLALVVAENGLALKETGTLYSNYAWTLYYMNRFGEAVSAAEQAARLGQPVDPDFLMMAKRKATEQKITSSPA